jgi:ribosome-associated protein
MADIEVQPGVTIPEREIWFTASKSGGPGGQHVNTTSSRVTLHWVPASSAAFDPVQRQRVLRKLEKRLTVEGELQLHVETHRSQHRNREEAYERLAAVVRTALHVRKRRRPTKPTRGSVERRIAEKKAVGDKKRKRGKVEPE